MHDWQLTPLAALQVRDEYRTDWDAERGGYGNIVKQEMVRRQEALESNMAMYNQGQDDGPPAPHPAKRQRRHGSDDDE